MGYTLIIQEENKKIVLEKYFTSIKEMFSFIKYFCKDRKIVFFTIRSMGCYLLSFDGKGINKTNNKFVNYPKSFGMIEKYIKKYF